MLAPPGREAPPHAQRASQGVRGTAGPPVFSPALGTAPVFALTWLVMLAAVARVIVPESDVSRGEAGAWAGAWLVLLLLASAEYGGYGTHARLVQTRVHHHHADVTVPPLGSLPGDLSLWRAERFATVAFWLAVAGLSVMLLAVFRVVLPLHALTVTACWAGPLPLVWYTSLLRFHTRPPAHWVRKILLHAGQTADVHVSGLGGAGSD